MSVCVCRTCIHILVDTYSVYSNSQIIRRILMELDEEESMYVPQT